MFHPLHFRHVWKRKQEEREKKKKEYLSFNDPTENRTILAFVLPRGCGRLAAAARGETLGTPSSTSPVGCQQLLDEFESPVQIGCPFFADRRPALQFSYPHSPTDGDFRLWEMKSRYWWLLEYHSWIRFTGWVRLKPVDATGNSKSLSWSLPTDSIDRQYWVATQSLSGTSVNMT